MRFIYCDAVLYAIGLFWRHLEETKTLERSFVTFKQSKLHDQFLTVSVECVSCGHIDVYEIFVDRKEEWKAIEKPICKKCAKLLKIA